MTSSPTLPGSTEKPILPNTYYEYTADTTKCDGGGANNIQGPAPLADKSNVALQLFALGDTPMTIGVIRAIPALKMVNLLRIVIYMTAPLVTHKLAAYPSIIPAPMKERTIIA